MANKKEIETGAKTIKKASKNEKPYSHEVVIKIDGDAWTKALEEVFKKKQKDARVDGFRKGKVPKDVFFKHFGKESLYLDAADLVLQDAYDKAMKESKLVPIVRPSVNLNDINDEYVEFTFKITTKPEVKINKYKGIKVEKEDTTVTKEDGKVEKGNIAIIDFEGFKDGKAFEGGKGENYSLEIGSNTFIPGFEDGVIGMKTGEEKDINLTFPEDYGAKDLAGKDVVFKVKVNEIKERINRKLDEEFFEDLGMDNVTNEKELRDSIEKSLKEQKELDADNKYIDSIITEISKNVEVDIPEELVEEEVDRLKHRMEHELSHQGISLDMYYQFTNTSEEDLNNQLEKEAYETTLYRLLLEEIRELEKIEATKEEIEEEISKLKDQYRMEEAQVLQMIGGEEAIKYEVEMKKTLDKLKELNK